MPETTGSTPAAGSPWMALAMRSLRVKVLPEPAPAMTAMGRPKVVAQRAWLGLSGMAIASSGSR